MLIVVHGRRCGGQASLSPVAIPVFLRSGNRRDVNYGNSNSCVVNKMAQQSEKDETVLRAVQRVQEENPTRVYTIEKQ